MNVSAHSGSRFKPRQPLRTVVEMADALGLPARTLAAYLGCYVGPRPAMKVKGGFIGTSRTYYEAAPVKAWWRALLQAHPELALKHGL